MNQTPSVGNEQPMNPQPYVENPYFANTQGAVAPDLDANAPLLRSSDVQRLNRKALVFLAGIVGILALAAVWLFGSALNRKPETANNDLEEQVVIPSAPKEVEQGQVVLDDSTNLGLAATDTAPPLPVVPDYAASAPALPSMPPANYGEMSSQQGPSLLERRMFNGGSGAVEAFANPGGAGGEPMMAPEAYQQMMGMPGMQPPPVAPVKPPQGTTSAQPLYRPDTLLLRGTYIRCVLETRIITDVPGFTSCVVTEPVYSVNGKRLLLPKGSKISGQYDSNVVRGERAVVVWDRITTPNGLDVNMQSPGVDNLGSAGHSGHYTAHWGERIASALLISMLSDAFKYAGAKHGPQQAEIINGAVVLSPYESNTASTIDRLANLALEKNMSRSPTVTINQGTVVNVYVSRDVDFSSVLR